MKKVFAAVLLLAGAARAEHSIRNHASVERLETETNRLVDVVRYSGLSYSIQREVFEFSRAVESLAQCAEYRTTSLGLGRNHKCDGELNQARYQFRQVESYLYDSQYDYPQVYRQYRQTAYALQNVQLEPGPGPGPGPQPTYSCVAVDNGWEEHAGGHVGYGRSVIEAQRVALSNCQRVHGSCRIRSCN